MVAENENADSKNTGADAVSDGSEGSHSPGKVEASEAPKAGAAESSSETEKTAPSSLEEKVKKGAKNYKGYLMKVGKLMIMLAILGSLLIGFATYMISSTFNNIFTKLEHPLE